MQIRMQGQQPDKLQGQKKRRKLPTWVRVVGFVLALLLIIIGAVVWVLNSLGSLTILLSTIFAAIGVVLGFLQLAPLVFPAKQTESSTISPHTPSITNNPQSQMLVESDETSFRGIQAIPPPTDPETILPRKKDVEEIYTWLTQPGTTAVALTGIGGIGKSTLAALVFNYVEDQRTSTTTGLFSGKSLWFSIDEKTSFLDLAGNLFDALDRPMPDFSTLAPQNQAEQLLTLLNTTDRSRLVVLDQFENLLDWSTGHALAERPGASEWLDAINSQHCSCRILLTCRPWPHGTREDPPTCLQEFPVRDLEVSEGMELLRKQGVMEVQASDSELRAAVMRCDAHTLALSLLASILRHNRGLKLKDLLEEKTYSHAWYGDIARNLLDYIYKVQLDDVQRQLLLAFSVFRVPVRLEAAQALMNKLSLIELLPALNVLLLQNLLQASTEGRYQLHAIVADYASRSFNVKSERANRRVRKAMHSKAVQYYLQQAARIYLTPNNSRIISDVQPFIEAIWHLCQAKHWQKAYDLAIREYLFADLRRWREYAVLLELCQLLLPRNWHPKPMVASLIYSYLAWAYDRLGEKEEAKLNYQEALSIYMKLVDRIGQGETLNNLGGVYLALGEREMALSSYEEALIIRREVGDRIGEITTLNNLGGVYLALGEKDKALYFYEEALRIRREAADWVGEDASLNNLGAVYLALGEKEKALSYYEEALYIRREAGDRMMEAATLQSLGEIYNDLGEKEKALSSYSEARRVRREIGDRNGESAALFGIGSVYEAIGEKEKALEYYEEALYMRQEVGNQGEEGETLLSIGALYSKLSNYEVALAYDLCARDIFKEIHSPLIDLAESTIGALHRVVGDLQFASLLATVEPQVQQIVEKSLYESVKI